MPMVTASNSVFNLSKGDWTAARDNNKLEELAEQLAQTVKRYTSNNSKNEENNYPSALNFERIPDIREYIFQSCLEVIFENDILNYLIEDYTNNCYKDPYSKSALDDTVATLLFRSGAGGIKKKYQFIYYLLRSQDILFSRIQEGYRKYIAELEKGSRSHGVSAVVTDDVFNGAASSKQCIYQLILVFYLQDKKVGGNFEKFLKGVVVALECGLNLDNYLYKNQLIEKKASSLGYSGNPSYSAREFIYATVLSRYKNMLPYLKNSVTEELKRLLMEIPQLLSQDKKTIKQSYAKLIKLETAWFNGIVFGATPVAIGGGLKKEAKQHLICSRLKLLKLLEATSLSNNQTASPYQRTTLSSVVPKH